MKHLRAFLWWPALPCAALLALLQGCSAPPAPPPPNEPPRALAGEDQTVLVQQQVTLDASQSSDPEGASLRFTWSTAADNPAAVLFPETQPRFSFVPTVVGTYVFVLTVSDGELTSAPDSVRVKVTTSGNRPPLADAGPDLIVAAGSPVPLSALNSSDPDGDALSYHWSVVAAPSPVALSDSTALQTSFTAAAGGEYRFRLTVSDGQASAQDEIVILVRASANQAPLADAGEDQQVPVGALVTLDGSKSRDPDGSELVLRYQWSVGRAPGGGVVLSDSTAARPTFIASEPGEYVFGLQVSDGALTSLQDVVSILVLERIFAEQEGMIEIPSGDFVMGSTEGAADERPLHRVGLSTFWIDKFEVTAAQYQACVEDGACTAAGRAAGCNAGRTDRGDHPANCLTWAQANTYCLWAGKRLPTEAEWEKAARGTDGRRYPWGDDPPSASRLNYANIVGATTMVGAYPQDLSFYGLRDMGGNVHEWTADFYAPDYYSLSPQQDPQGPASGTLRVGRGASWKIGVPQEALTATVRTAFVPGTADNTLGFRCARSQPPAP